MRLPHLCGPDEIRQDPARRPAFSHVGEVVTYLSDPASDSWGNSPKFLTAVIDFTFGYCTGTSTSTYSPAQAQWGTLQLLRRSTSWSSNRYVSYAAHAVVAALEEVGLHSFGAAIEALWLVTRPVDELANQRMAQLKPIVLVEWTSELAQRAGAAVRFMVMIGAFRPEIKSPDPLAIE
jgi:hypothetical protein